MKIRTNVYDLWVFHRQETEPKYLLLHTSQEKADKWFNGGRFWQILGDFTKEDTDVTESIKSLLISHDLNVLSAWTTEHVSMYYNIRRKNVEITPAFAAEVQEPKEIPLTWEHKEFGWFSALECLERIKFRGLIEGLEATKKIISKPLPELKLF